MDYYTCLVVGIYMVGYLNLRTWQYKEGVWRVPISLFLFAVVAAAMTAYGLPMMAGLLLFLLVDLFLVFRKFPV
mgnify:CR=1 FL=1